MFGIKWDLGFSDAFPINSVNRVFLKNHLLFAGVREGLWLLPEKQPYWFQSFIPWELLHLLLWTACKSTVFLSWYNISQNKTMLSKYRYELNPTEVLQSLPFPLDVQCDDGQKEEEMTSLVNTREEMTKFSSWAK